MNFNKTFDEEIWRRKFQNLEPLWHNRIFLECLPRYPATRGKTIFNDNRKSINKPSAREEKITDGVKSMKNRQK